MHPTKEQDNNHDFVRLNPVVSNAARDTVHPTREIHSATPVDTCLAWGQLHNAKWCWAFHTGWRASAGDHIPHSLAYTGPNRVDAGGERKSRPPSASQAVTVTARSPAAPQRAGRAPRGPGARRAKRGSRDNAYRARMGPTAGS
jgi:hypothetical protein